MPRSSELRLSRRDEPRSVLLGLVACKQDFVEVISMLAKALGLDTMLVSLPTWMAGSPECHVSKAPG